jgi:hypothetical protein
MAPDGHGRRHEDGEHQQAPEALDRDGERSRE